MEKTIFDCILLLIFGFIILIKGSNYFVDGASNLAKKMKIPSVIIGLTLVSIGTSLPELSASITSSILKDSDMNFGNVIGSNIFNLLVVIGASSLFAPLVISKQIIKYDIPILLSIYVLLTLFTVFDNKLSLLEAIIIFILSIAYTIFLLFRNKNEIKNERIKLKNNEIITKINVFKCLFYIIIGIIAIILGGKILINNAILIANYLKVPSLVISLTIIAIGTSLPELITSIIATIKKENDIAVANVIGSNIYNIILILSLSSIIHPLNVALWPNLIDIIIMTFTTILFLILVYKNKIVKRWHGILFILLYLIYIAFLLLRELI